ncbi:MAG: biotin--[acetyl-CoA-carboxylase] ligase [Anaerolineales bacterium]
MTYSQSALEAALTSLPLGTPLHYFERIGSTNDEARRLAENGAPEGTLVVADEQTAGRGRAGRTWVTPAGSAIAASFILRPALASSQLGVLSLVGGLAAAIAIENVCALRSQLKWPNDVWLRDRKVCGVLAEASHAGDARVDWVVLGIGINVSGAPPGGANLRYPATTVEAASGRAVDRTALLVALAEALADYYITLDAARVVHAWSKHMLWRGQTVRVDTGRQPFTGVVRGVSADGGLVLTLDGGETHTIAAGEISLLRKTSEVH